MNKTQGECSLRVCWPAQWEHFNAKLTHKVASHGKTFLEATQASLLRVCSSRGVWTDKTGFILQREHGLTRV